MAKLSVVRAGKTEEIHITPLNFKSAALKLVGTSPYVQHAFSVSQRQEMERTQTEGSVSRGRKKRAPKDFEKLYNEAIHVSSEGWYGIPAAAFRSAMISACSIAGFMMTRAKKAIFVVPDGNDANSGQPLVRIYGEPKIFPMHVRLASGVVDVTHRPRWDEWHAIVTVEWDADVLSANDIVNLLVRAGRQVGIGDGRHDSRNSVGLGFGCWMVENL